MADTEFFGDVGCVGAFACAGWADKDEVLTGFFRAFEAAFNFGEEIIT